MGWYERQVLPRVIDKLCGNAQMAKIRRPSLEGLHGRVVEVGFGSGPNVALYPDAVEHVYAIDPSEVGRRLAAARVAGSRVPVEYVGLDGASIPLADASADSALSTWTLCTIPDVTRALLEVRRVLKPGGELFFLEHGLSDDPRIARRQRRFTPMQKKIAGGCHLDRDIEALVRDAGFTIDHLTTFTLAGPKTAGFMYRGVAVAPG